VREDIENHFAKPAIAAYSHKGEQYCIPLTTESIVLWYNRDAMEEADLTPPREIENDPDKGNWNTLVEYAKVLNKGSGPDRERFGLVASGPISDYGLQIGTGNFLYANGGRYLNEDGTQWILNSPESREAHQYVLDLIYEHDVHPDVATLSVWATTRTMFQTGQAAMVVEGEFLRRYLWGVRAPKEGIPFNYDLALLPFSPKKTQGMVYHCLGVPIMKDSKHPDEAWKWLKVIASLEGQQNVTDHWGSRGADERTYEPWLAANAGGGPDGLNFDAISRSDVFGVPFPVSPYLVSPALLEPHTRIMYDLILQRKVDLEKGLVDMEEEINGRIEKSMKEMGVT